MPTSARFGIDYPLGSEAPDIDGDILKIVNALESLGAQYGQGTLAARPVSTPGSPGKQGRFYIVTSGAETGQLHYDFGTGWLWLNNIPTIGPDTITNVEIAPLTITSAELANGIIGSVQLADGNVTAAKLAAALKPSGGAGGGTEALRALGMGAGLALSQAQIANINMIGTLAARPTANTVVSGTKYFATDQVVEYISDGTNWHRVSAAAGTTTAWFRPDAAVPSGYVKYDGSNLPSSTGIYADLYGHLGGLTTPNTKGRAIVGQDPADADFDVILEVRGAKTHTLSVAELAPHTHRLDNFQHSADNAGNSPTAIRDFASTPDQVGPQSVSTGGGAAHNNIQPSIVAVYIAKL
jgi:microcystin-dependent protein